MKQYFAPCLAVIALVGCDKKPAEQPQQAQAPQAAAPAPAAAPNNPPSDAPVITVATTGLGAPLTYKDEQGILQGIDIDVIRAVGERQGFKVEVVPEAWAKIFDETDSGKYDVALAGISWTPERAGKYSLTDAYYFNPASFVYKKSSGFEAKTLADLTNKKVGVLKGSKHEKIAEQAGITQLINAESGAKNFVYLAQGEIDAYIHDYINLRYLQASHNLPDLVIEPIENESEKTANLVMVVSKSKPELVGKINQGLAQLKADGTINKIVEKHMAIVPKAK